MIDFKDVTFIIPIKFDSEDRKQNFKITINHLLNNFETNIIVMESDIKSNKDFIDSITKKIDYIFDQNETGIFHRTKMLNHMTKKCNTDIVVNYDIDVIFKIDQYIESRKKIKDGCGFCFPYEGKFYDIKENYFPNIEKNQFDLIDLNKCTLFNPNSLGGALFFDKNVYKKIGFENQNFISWGYEDWERVTRINKMGLNICRSKGVLYHLTHKRDHNSNETNPNYLNNQREFNKITNMNKEQLSKEILNWSWIKN